MSKRVVSEPARLIAERLFTNGQNERAARLVLELPDKTDGGGWSIKAAYDRIKQVMEPLQDKIEALQHELLMKYPIHGRVTISVVDAALKLARAEEKVAELEVRNHVLVNGGDFGWNQVAEQAATIAQLTKSIVFAEHKLDQHLQGQYNNAPYPALGAALAELRTALSKQEKK